MAATAPHLTPFVLLLGTLSFLCSFAFHVGLWRSGTTATRTMGRLFTIFLGIPALSFAGVFAMGQLFGSESPGLVGNPFAMLHGFVWHGALAAVYLMTYPAIQAESPSLVVLRAIADAMPAGLDWQEIAATFHPDALVNDRLADLLTDGLVCQQGGQYQLTAKGGFLATIFAAYRRVLGLPCGEG